MPKLAGVPQNFLYSNELTEFITYYIGLMVFINLISLKVDILTST